MFREEKMRERTDRKKVGKKRREENCECFCVKGREKKENVERRLAGRIYVLAYNGTSHRVSTANKFLSFTRNERKQTKPA